MLDHPATSPETTGFAVHEPEPVALPDPFRVPLTAEAFESFPFTRPDDERWELFDGVPVMRASPNGVDQVIAGNLSWALTEHERRMVPKWMVHPGIGMRIEGQPASAPGPDVLARARSPGKLHWCDDLLALIEVLSTSTADRDLRSKRRNYPRFATLDTYAVVAQDRAEVTVFSCGTGFAARDLAGADAVLELDALGVDVPHSVIYWRTGPVSDGTVGEG